MSAYSIIDVDTHVTETPGVWVDRVPAAMRDKVPYVEMDEKGRQCWYLNGKRLAIIGLTATAGRGDMMSWPATFDDMHPGAYDAHARLEYMDEVGIWAQVLYPNVGGFGSQEFLKLADAELEAGLRRGVQRLPARVGLGRPPAAAPDHGDAVLGHRRRRRARSSAARPWATGASCSPASRSASGCRSSATALGPAVGGGAGEPACRSASTSAAGDMVVRTSPERVASPRVGRRPTPRRRSTLFLKNGVQVADLLLSRRAAPLPRAEVRVGGERHRLDPVRARGRSTTSSTRTASSDERPEFDMLPSEYFQRQVYACYWFEQIAPRRLHRQDRRRPHPVRDRLPPPHLPVRQQCTSASTPASATVDDAVRRKILWENAQKLYHVDEPTPADEEKVAALAR